MAQGLPNLCVPCSSPDGVTTVWYIGLSVCSRYRILSQSELLLSCLQPYCITAPLLSLQSACEHGCQLPGHLRCRDDSSLAVYCVCDYSRLLQSWEVSVL